MLPGAQSIGLTNISEERAQQPASRRFRLSIETQFDGGGAVRGRIRSYDTTRTAVARSRLLQYLRGCEPAVGRGCGTRRSRFARLVGNCRVVLFSAVGCDCRAALGTVPRNRWHVRLDQARVRRSAGVSMRVVLFHL